MKVRVSDVLAWEQVQRKMNQVLVEFGLLDFTMLRPFSLGAHFETTDPFISLNFRFFGPR
jgi:hypothetical protein